MGSSGRPDPIPILLYHSVSEQPSTELSPWSITPETFRRHLDCIIDAGLHPITVSAFAEAISSGGEPPEHPVLVTFDDGYADFLPAAEEMASRGIASTLYVTTGILDRSRTYGIPAAPMLLSDQLAPLEALGVELGAHSHRHLQIDVAPRAVAHEEIVRPKAILEDLLGHAVGSYSYPRGCYRNGVREQVRSAGYTSACGVRNAFSSITDHPFSLARLTVRDFTTIQTLHKWLRGTGAPVAPRRELARTRVWRIRRWIAATESRRLDPGA